MSAAVESEDKGVRGSVAGRIPGGGDVTWQVTDKGFGAYDVRGIYPDEVTRACRTASGA